MARQIKLYFCHRYSGRKLSEIGKRFGIGLSVVTQASRRIGLKAKKEKKLGKLLKRIENNLRGYEGHPQALKFFHGYRL